MIRIHIEPDNQVRTLDKSTTALRLLARLGLRPSQALVSRGRELLTPDRRVEDGDEVVVRKVVSLG
jgi:sulfur carrier protein